MAKKLNRYSAKDRKQIVYYLNRAWDAIDAALAYTVEGEENTSQDAFMDACEQLHTDIERATNIIKRK